MGRIRALAMPLLPALILATASPAAAVDGDVTVVLGAFIGDELQDLRLGTLRLRRAFDNAPLYGVRVSWFAFPLGIEGSLVGSPSGLSRQPLPGVDLRVIYLEGGVVLLLFPGPVSPFLVGGIGLHSFKLGSGTEAQQTQVGYNLGGGLRVAFGSLGVRVDLRDHITPFEAAELDPAFAVILGRRDLTLHNLEFSGGLTIRF